MLAPFLKTLLHFESVPMVSTIESLAKAHESEVHELESHTDKSAVKISKAFDIIECNADRGSSVRRASDTLADTFKVAAFLVLAIVVRNTFTDEDDESHRRHFGAINPESDARRCAFSGSDRSVDRRL
jgi:hypothetical protein